MNTEEKFDEYEFGIKAVNMLLNNEWETCDKMLIKYKEQSPMLSYCYALFKFAKSVLIFEESELERAHKELDKTQKFCKEYIKTHGLAKKPSKSGSQAAQNDLSKSKLNNVADKISKEIIIADSKLYIALLTILRQDIPAILTTGVFELRKAWKLYSSIQKKLFNIFKQLEPNAELIYGTDPNKLPDVKIDENNNNNNNNEQDEIQEISIDNVSISEDGLDLDTVKILLAGVSYGYGILQLCFSFLPPSILKLMKFIGFEGDRSSAIKALYFTAQSKDIRSSFADITLLFYSLMGRQLFGYSEIEMYLNEKEIVQVLDKNLNECPNSCLFLLQKSKYFEYIKKDLKQTFEFLQKAQESASKLPEMKCITWYEMGLIHLLNLDYQSALSAFTEFSKSSKWSLSFNALLVALLNGCLGNFELANQQIKAGSKISQPKNPIEIYAQRRIEFLKKNTIKAKITCEFFIIELLFLWVYIPYADEEHLNKMLAVLDQQTDKTFTGLKSLIEGLIQLELKNPDIAEILFKESIDREEKSKSSISKYLHPYANLQLCLLAIDRNELNSAYSYLSKAKNYKDYELEDRIQMQMRCVQRRLDYKKSIQK